MKRKPITLPPIESEPWKKLVTRAMRTDPGERTERQRLVLSQFMASLPPLRRYGSDTTAATNAVRIPLPMDAVIEDYKAGLSVTQIALKYRVTRDTIRRRLTKAGVV
jgi:hypothetical protein